MENLGSPEFAATSDQGTGEPESPRGQVFVQYPAKNELNYKKTGKLVFVVEGACTI